jgi:8-oxo-dGTP pyrophosphatase MutT (NUDIX family)
MTPKICLTASALLIHQNKVLLIKHKKLNLWLGPGGHIDEGESPHQAAEREFLEETGLQVQVYNPSSDSLCASSDETNLFHHLPIAINEHWVCQENYQMRLAAASNHTNFSPVPMWKKGCEKHFNFTYLARLLGPLQISPQPGESQLIEWFSLSDLQGKYRAELASSILKEATRAFELAKPD